MRFPKLLALLGIAAFAGSAAAADVGVSVTIGQPGFYGRLDIGGFPQPALIYQQPMMIQAVPLSRPPLYLRVPPGHARNWGKYCYRYHACGERVFFVRDDWYRQEYMPRYQERHHGGPEWRDERRDDWRGRRDDRRDDRFDRRDDRRDERWDDRGRGHDHGHGHGRDR
jgi:hypothetical protein